MSRSKWKGPYLDTNLLKLKTNKSINVWNRSSIIPYALVGKSILIHNGKTLVKVYITREKVGFKIGELVFTKKHTKKIIKLKKK